ncbi:hypothetical protein C0Q70_10821 [Pomacea canaliculata]|uniref:Uncharacterized protein n=1 Tax=Pomacea canaliculata TaxID=400727 RepID=A0A2T7P483_POMCA|nr:hypothetical protein C0Q70_10821 [Pomacea canaliculata]
MPYFKIKEKKKPTTIVKIYNNLTGRWVTLKENKRKKKDTVSAAPSQPNTVIATSSQQPIPTTSSINVEPMAVVIAASSQQPIPTTSSIDVEPMAVGRALGKKGRNLSFPYKKHFLAPVVKVTGMPEGVEFKHPSKYTVSELKKIIANKAHIKMELIAPSVAEEPSLCAADFQQTPVVADVFMASDPPSEVVQTTLVQDMHSKEEFCKATPGIRAKNQRTGFRTLWTAEEVLIVQQHFSQELAGLKPVSRSSIESFLAQQTVVKRTSTAVGNYLLRNRKKKNRPNDQG